MGRPRGLSKTGGRKVGTPNKANSANAAKVAELCLARGFDPLEAMIELAQSGETELSQKISLLKEITQYVYPKRKSIEVSAEVNGEISSAVQIVLPDNGTATN